MDVFSWNLGAQAIFGFLGILSVLGLFVFVERALVLYKALQNDAFWMEALQEALLARQLSQVYDLAEKGPILISALVKVALPRIGDGSASIDRALLIQGRLEAARLEKNVYLLSLVATIAPALAFLGALFAFLSVLPVSGAGGAMDGELLKEALYIAILLLATGLTVSIPAALAYNYLVNQIQLAIAEIDMAHTYLLDLFERSEDAL